MRDYRGQYEVHVTVNTSHASAIPRFREWCGHRRLKCVRILLDRGAHAEQPMATWHRQDTILPSVMEDAEACAAEMNRAGFPVVRVKIEAALDNQEIPLRDDDAKVHPPKNYFEHHVKMLRAANAPRELLLEVCEKHGAHLSRNAFRQRAGDREERFVTLRSYGVGRMSSEAQLRQLRTALEDLGERIIGCESEYCVYDTNLGLDAGWLREQA